MWQGNLQSNIFSGAIFDAEFYARMYGLKNMTRNDLRQAWQTGLETRKYPNCQQGSYLFSVNK